MGGDAGIDMNDQKSLTWCREDNEKSEPLGLPRSLSFQTRSQAVRDPGLLTSPATPEESLPLSPVTADYAAASGGALSSSVPHHSAAGGPRKRKETNTDGAP